MRLEKIPPYGRNDGSEKTKKMEAGGGYAASCFPSTLLQAVVISSEARNLL
jgi:hypothetical protein